MDSRKQTGNKSKINRVELIKMFILIVLIAIGVFAIMQMKSNYQSNFVEQPIIERID